MFLFDILFATPLAALVWFVISIVKYCRTPKENTEERRKKRRMVIASAITAAVINGALITIIILFLIGLSHM
ncbi:MAG: hypothetical protein K2K34_04805 [Oscillospiraceae bacterium]|nr:hypothetical protein [Oscillospiraceae bacterium]